MPALSKEEQVREDTLFQNRKIRTIPLRFNTYQVDDDGNWWVIPAVGTPGNPGYTPEVRGKTSPMPAGSTFLFPQFNQINQPVHQIAAWTADETVQFRGLVISEVPVPLQDWLTMYFILSTASSPQALAGVNNRESTWCELFTDAYRPAILPFMLGGEYDGFYLNVGETVRLYYGCNDNWAAAAHGQIYQCMQGTAMIYFLPTYRQSR